jgi:methylphosphotriester-DNA--protein-cysteine methyltransferase
MFKHFEIAGSELKRMMLSNRIKFGGNANLKIYGTLTCFSGKRMKKQNRVFFSNEKDAIAEGFRPCGHCLRDKYLQWIEQGSG